MIVAIQFQIISQPFEMIRTIRCGCERKTFVIHLRRVLIIKHCKIGLIELHLLPEDVLPDPA